jgi:hypothetical protein
VGSPWARAESTPMVTPLAVVAMVMTVTTVMTVGATPVTAWKPTAATAKSLQLDWTAWEAAEQESDTAAATATATSSYGKSLAQHGCVFRDGEVAILPCSWAWFYHHHA